MQRLPGIFKDAMWVTIPILPRAASFVNGNVPPSEVKIKLLVARPYTSPASTGSESAALKYSFNTNDLASDKGNNEVAKQALDLVQIVPNPYYAHSDYENSQFDNRIKITNLPRKSTISIYSVNGTLIRTIVKETTSDVSLGADKENKSAIISNDIEWDLKNAYGIPISSGIYIFHIKSAGLPDKVVKWLAVMRPLDVSNY